MQNLHNRRQTNYISGVFMSLYCFIASDKKLPPLSVGIDDQGDRIIIEDERHILNIFEDSPNSYAEPFTDKPIIMCVETGIDFTTVSDDLLSYIQNAMVGHKSIELWVIWIGTVSLGDRTTEKRSVSVNELTADDLFWIFGELEYSHPKCLKVFKWTKG